MAAVITDRLKKQLLVDIYRDFQDSDSFYFAGIGRSEDWNDSDVVPANTPNNTLRDDRNFRLGLQSVKNITDISFVVPRVNWSSGTVYEAYNDNQTGYPLNSYYVMNDNQQVYICLQKGRNNASPAADILSTVQPTGNTDGAPFETADGYIWKFLYSIGALKASKFISSAYIPVQKVQDSAGAPLLLDEVGVDSDSPAEDVEQQLIQQSAVPGQIVGYRVVNSGSGYTSTPTVQISGDGTGAAAAATVAGNVITKVTVANPTSLGQDYTYASVSLVGGGGTGAEVIPILAPKGGLGADPRVDLRSSAIMFNTKTSGEEGGDFIVDNDFRQLGLLKNITLNDSDGLFTEETGRALKRFDLASINNGPFVVDQVIEGTNSNAKAFIDDVNADSDYIWIHQTEYTGFDSFEIGEQIGVAEGGGSTTANIQSVLQGEFDPHSGELLYIDNRTPVIRSTDQTEDLKIVIQL